MGSGPVVPEDPEDKLDTSPITEKAAESLQEKKDVLEALAEDK